MSARPRVVRVMLPNPGCIASDDREGFLVCSGEVGKPAHRCEWIAVAWYSTEAKAHTEFGRLDPHKGRAVFTLSNEDLQLISPAGVILNEDPVKAFGRRAVAQLGPPVSTKVVVVGGDNVTLPALPVGHHLVIHREVEVKDLPPPPKNLWTITHVASGLAAEARVRGKTLAAAIAVALSELPLSWGNLDPFAGIVTGLHDQAYDIAKARTLEDLRTLLIDHLLS